MESPESAVVPCHRPLTLQDVYLDARLVVGRGRKDLSRFFVGMVVLRAISVVITPPSVSTPKDSGVTSNSSTSFPSPASTPPCTAAPTATTSSGFTPLCGSLPKYSRTSCWTLGIRVEPPTSTTSSTFDAWRPASASACFTGPSVRCTSSLTKPLERRASELHRQVLRSRLVRRDEGQVDVGLERRPTVPPWPSRQPLSTAGAPSDPSTGR